LLTFVISCKKGVDVKKNKLNIIYSWLLLVCFVAGQYMVYSHQHQLLKSISKTASLTNNDHSPQTTVKEKCDMCDAMHHTFAVIDTLLYATPQQAVIQVFKPCNYDFVSISLVLAAGRAPPVIS
jgi:glycerol-3-phosphate dehydrogenase